MTIVLATLNSAKARELEDILRALLDNETIVVITADRLLGQNVYIEEKGATLEENAYMKASYVFERTLLPTIADDTGLEVAALNGAPGVHTARFAGDSATAADNNLLLLDKLKGVVDRRAQFRTVLCYRDPLRTIFAEGICSGSIALEPRGAGDLGMIHCLFRTVINKRSLKWKRPKKMQSRTAGVPSRTLCNSSSNYGTKRRTQR